jgi:hypothetical protein
MTDLFEAPPAFPSSPLLQTLLLESPGGWFTAVALAILGIVLLIKFRRIAIRIAGGVCLLLAGAVTATHMLVVTDHEEVMARTRQVAQAAAAANTAELHRLLAPTFQGKYFAAPSGIDREETIRRCQNFFAVSPVELRVSDVDVVIDNERFARSQVLVSGRGDLTGGYPALSWWVLVWEHTSEGWQVTAAEPFSMQGMRNPGGR